MHAQKNANFTSFNNSKNCRKLNCNQNLGFMDGEGQGNVYNHTHKINK